jgi:hypothetical protein
VTRRYIYGAIAVTALGIALLAYQGVSWGTFPIVGVGGMLMAVGIVKGAAAYAMSRALRRKEELEALLHSLTTG